jgi:hypothetical protein
MKENNEPLAVGDRVQRRAHPRLTGTVRSFDIGGKVIVRWDGDDPRDPAWPCHAEPAQLERISRRSRSRPGR